MVSASVKVEGVESVTAALARVQEEMPDTLEAVHRAAAQLVVAAALPNVPVRSGRLRASVKTVATPEVGVAYAGGGPVPYGNVIHWGRKRGNVGSPPGNHEGRNVVVKRPFLWDALNRVEEKVVAQHDKAIHDLIAELGLNG